jgi:hypothetical protein
MPSIHYSCFFLFFRDLSSNNECHMTNKSLLEQHSAAGESEQSCPSYINQQPLSCTSQVSALSINSIQSPAIRVWSVMGNNYSIHNSHLTSFTRIHTIVKPWGFVTTNFTMWRLGSVLVEHSGYICISGGRLTDSWWLNGVNGQRWHLRGTW